MILQNDKEGRKLNCQKIFLKKILKQHMRKRILAEIVEMKSTHGMTIVMSVAGMDYSVDENGELVCNCLTCPFGDYDEEE